MITIYGKENCPYCEAAKGFFQFLDMEYEYRDATSDKEVQSEFRRLFPEAKTVPQIIIDNHHIGGYEELIEVTDENGELQWNLIKNKSEVI